MTYSEMLVFSPSRECVLDLFICVVFMTLLLFHTLERSAVQILHTDFHHHTNV